MSSAQQMHLTRYFYTYFDHNYAPQGLAMYRSLRRHCPGAHLFVLCLSDQAQVQLQARQLPGLTIITLNELEAGDSALVAAKQNRSRIEYIFTCTPALGGYVFQHFPEVDLLTYLDADLYFFSDVEPMFCELGDSSIGIIPHDFTAKRYLRFGRFNVGWVSFRRDANALACLAWWREQCLAWCHDRVEATRYADQKYLDEWPTRFAGVHVYANPGANLARWNIGNRAVTEEDGELLVCGRPLIFFHFASFKQLNAWLFETNFSSHFTRPNRLVRERIFGQYIAELRHISGNILPHGPRRAFLQGLGRRSVSDAMRQFLIILRSLLWWDLIIVGDLAKLDAEFVHRVGTTTRPAAGAGRARRKKAWFAFADASLHSGQKEASRLIYSSLDRAEWDVHIIVMPGFEHNEPGLVRWLRYGFRLLKAWAEFIPVICAESPVVHVGIGQTHMALLRDGIPLKALQLFNRRAHVAISLQGSLFMDWLPENHIASSFTRIAGDAACVTVLGPNQRRKMISLGIPENKVVICDNTSAAAKVSLEAVAHKQGSAGPVRVLFLSTLIETKGYPEFLEAVEILAGRPGPKLEVVLSGRVLVGAYSDRFLSPQAATAWITSMIARLNQADRIKARWIDGADGERKWDLYREAHIVVLPSRYKVEAQPIVLLEGMAHGCAIITSQAGEIPSMFPRPDTAILLSEPSAASIAEAIDRLVRDPALRGQMALAGRRLYDEKFSPEIYAAKWRHLLTTVPAPR
jgi:glycosyltransferase involved in cell wall biosynthesis